jgi:putative transposase
MSTYTQIIYQIVFSTKYRDNTLKGPRERLMLYKYMWGILNKNHCVLYKINGVENHLHIATHIHPAVSLSSLVKDIKVSSSLWIKEHKIFPGFIGWSVGYGAFTYTIKEKDALVAYIDKQVKHHYGITFHQEYKDLLRQHGIKYKEKFLF